VVFRSSIQFIDGLTALLGPCYAEARCRVKKIDAPDSRSEMENEGRTRDLIVPALVRTLPDGERIVSVMKSARHGPAKVFLP